MDSPQYIDEFLDRVRSYGPGFKPYYKWIVLNTDLTGNVWITAVIVLNLIING